MKSVDYTDLDAAFYKWFIQNKYEGIQLSGLLIQNKALILNFKFSGFNDFKASSGWLEDFKVCLGIR